MYQPHPSSSQPTAVKLMYAGAAASAAELVIGLALIIVDIKVAARGQFLGHSLTSPQARPLVITAWIIFGLIVTATWLLMARANAQRRNWARTLSTVLFVLATLSLSGAFTKPASHAGSGATVLYNAVAALFAAAWLAGAAAVWLLWRPRDPQP
jgi:hypothetical protein